MYERRYIDLDSSKLKAPFAIVGLPGIGSVGKIAAETLAGVLGAQKIMDFFSDDFPARVFVKDGLAHFPKSSMHIYNSAPDEPHDLIILTADFQPSSGKGVFEYADYVAQELNKLGVKEIYALAAYEQGYQEFFKSYPLPPRVYISASSEQILQKFSEIEGTLATKEGVINGANGVIPAWATSMYNLEGGCLLGETFGMIKVDYRAAQAVLERIATYIGTKVDYDILDEPVSKVVEFIEWAKKEIEQRGTSNEDGESPSDRYIG
ncbi:MAG: PAC2 family protein [Candidatus Thorarchaeota archaeon]|jgi:proteasome assembly chaperone (PAC2) family protein